MFIQNDFQKNPAKSKKVYLESFQSAQNETSQGPTTAEKLDDLKEDIVNPKETLNMVNVTNCITELKNKTPVPNLNELINILITDQNILSIINSTKEEKKEAVKIFLSSTFKENGMGEILNIIPGYKVVEHYEANKKINMQAHTEVRIIPTIITTNEDGSKNWELRPIGETGRFNIEQVDSEKYLGAQFDGTIEGLKRYFNSVRQAIPQ